MNAKKISTRQLIVWMVFACIAPSLQLAGRDNYLTLCIAGIISAVVCGTVLYTTAGESQSKLLCLLQILWIIPTIALFGQYSMDIWPDARNNPIIPMLLLGLAVVSSVKGSDTAVRCNSTLAWFVGILLVVLLAAGSKQINVKWLTPKTEMPSAEIMLVLILPAAAAALANKDKTLVLTPLLLTGFLMIFAAITVGTLSGKLAEMERWPFYEAAKGYKLFDAAQRFEALVSAVSTVCYFALMSLLLSVLSQKAEVVKLGSSKAGIVVSALLSISLIILVNPIPAEYLAIAGGIVWVLWPITEHLKKLWKKLKNLEKNT